MIDLKIIIGAFFLPFAYHDNSDLEGMHLVDIGEKRQYNNNEW